jgi:hypothetical protein
MYPGTGTEQETGANKSILEQFPIAWWKIMHICQFTNSLCWSGPSFVTCAFKTNCCHYRPWLLRLAKPWSSSGMFGKTRRKQHSKFLKFTNALFALSWLTRKNPRMASFGADLSVHALALGFGFLNVHICLFWPRDHICRSCLFNTGRLLISFNFNPCHACSSCSLVLQSIVFFQK